MPQNPSRREFLKTTLAAGAASLLPGASTAEGGCATSRSSAPQAFRFVHLTDIHVQLERDAHKGMARALEAAEALKPRPDFILTGGDLIMDALEHDAAHGRRLFELYNKVIADHTSLPVHNTIGNHDVLGWSPKSGLSPRVAGYGKALAKDMLRLRETYHAFEHRGWRFFCLDNIQPGDGERYPYNGYLDGPQMDWLKQELERADASTPIVMCEHIPLVTATGFGHENLVKEREWRFPSALICTDAARRVPLLRTRNVRLCLSGHIHERDRIELGGVTFVNDGAVCGNWWKGAYRGVPEGFGVIDCRGDGGFEYGYHAYGWKAVGE